eukprot:scaffold6426_cov98-Isochrysis_galbana.AAC.2
MSESQGSPPGSSALAVGALHSAGVSAAARNRSLPKLNMGRGTVAWGARRRAERHRDARPTCRIRAPKCKIGE